MKSDTKILLETLGLLFIEVSTDTKSGRQIANCMIDRKSIYIDKVNPDEIVAKTLAYFNATNSYQASPKIWKISELPHKTPSAHWAFKIQNF